MFVREYDFGKPVHSRLDHAMKAEMVRASIQLSDIVGSLVVRVANSARFTGQVEFLGGVDVFPELRNHAHLFRNAGKFRVILQFDEGVGVVTEEDAAFAKKIRHQGSVFEDSKSGEEPFEFFVCLRSVSLLIHAVPIDAMI